MFIYGLIDPRTECLRYVGKTTDLRKRFLRHCNPRRSDRSHRGCWLRGLRNLGLQPTMVVLEEIDEATTALVECFWISSLRAAGADLVNAANGGEGGATRTGQKSSAAHRMNIAKAHLGMRPDASARERMRWTPARREKMQLSVALRNPHPHHIKKHGTSSAYAWGCRCVDCLAFIDSRAPARKDGRPRVRQTPSQHGTTTMYAKGCRCNECKSAATRYAIARRKLREDGIAVLSERQLAVRQAKFSERRKRALEIARHRGRISLPEFARDLKLDSSTLVPVLRTLVAEGVLRSTGKTRRRVYVLADE